jgi:hypothetical protein
LSGGNVSSSDANALNDALQDSALRRKLRTSAFYGFGALASIFLIAFCFVVAKLLTSEQLLAILSGSHEWHFITVLGIALVSFAAVPLSMVLALLKMISADDSSETKEEISLTTPQVEFLKIVVEMVKAGLGK